ncbi:2-C-methyl-D-erythritol 4-phosphate cytidylyltransferase [Peptostreptococcaceae bacterium OttesenSCG-928-C18]|nr:2-C-methyl-D-erythritol 4-phosphate cytidylyltransferase [Peptostreptococcaceae bacterium OttesenSCG-928-C18]
MNNLKNDFKNIGISVIITAAGSGTRMGSNKPKQFIELQGVPIIERTLKKFYNIDLINEIIIIVREDDLDFYDDLVCNYSSKLKIVIGGKTREESTYNGLLETNESNEIIICHDGVRPFVSEEIILNSIKSMRDYNAVVVAVPAKDTIKSVREDNTIAYTPKRKFLYNAQTPQVFKRNLIMDAYKKAFQDDIQVTDDSSLMEVIGEKVKIIEGSYSNIKITTKEDLIFGEIIAQREALDENRDRI